MPAIRAKIDKKTRSVTVSGVNLAALQDILVVAANRAYDGRREAMTAALKSCDRLATDNLAFYNDILQTVDLLEKAIKVGRDKCFGGPVDDLGPMPNPNQSTVAERKILLARAKNRRDLIDRIMKARRGEGDPNDLPGLRKSMEENPVKDG